MARATEHKEGKATVNIVYYTHKTLSDGSHPFLVRITKDRKNRWISTGISIHPEFWNKEKNTFRKNVPEKKRTELEVALRNWKDRYTDAAETLAGDDEVHDVKSVAEKVSSERLSTRKFKLLTYFDEIISQFDKAGNIGNRRVYRDVQNSLRRFLGKDEDVSFEAVTVKFCNEWETKMRSEGVTEVTLSLRFRTLRAILNKAIANGYSKATSYPFARNSSEKNKFQIGKFDTKTSKRAVSKADIRKIDAYQPSKEEGKYATLRNTQERLQVAKDIFLFSYYCGGINFVDIAALKWSNIGKDLDNKPRLSYIRQKTGGKFTLLLITQSLAILERYRPQELLNTSYIFPILNSTLHKTPAQKHNRCSKIMGQVNVDLKTIGIAVGIETPLTTYVARHSFATALKRSGVTTGVISEAMGHRDERTTQIYLSEFETDLVDAAFENL
ncbi:site-specific integrase [Spirosoma aerophilum]